MNIYNTANELCVLDNLALYQEDFQPIYINITQADGTVAQIDTIVVKFIICEIDDESIVLLEKIGVNDVDTDISVVTLETADTANIMKNKYIYKIEIIYNTGDKNIGKGILLIQ